MLSRRMKELRLIKSLSQNCLKLDFFGRAVLNLICQLLVHKHILERAMSLHCFVLWIFLLMGSLMILKIPVI